MSKGTIMTVLGPIAPEKLGVTIGHEHLVFDLSCYLRDDDDPELMEQEVTLENLHRVQDNPYGNRHNCVVSDIELPIKELQPFLACGGQSIIDQTLDDFGRDVKALAEISKRTGIHIVAGCGHYIQSAHPEYVKDMTVEELAEELIAECRDGVGDTGIKPGIIGEIGTGFVLHEDEVKNLRAAAIAQQETGRAITVHIHPPVRHAHRVLDILEESGADLNRVSLCHMDGCLAHPDITFEGACDYLYSLADRGAYLEFDLCGNSYYFRTSEISWWLPSDRERARAIFQLCLRGFSRQITLSHDVGHRHYLTSYGGWGYAHVLSGFQRTLCEAGVSEYDRNHFIVDNPARLVTLSNS